MMSDITLSVDTNVGAAYIKLTDEPIVETVEVNPDVQVDIDSMGAVVGVEILNLATDIPADELVARFHFRESDHALALSQLRRSAAVFVSSASSGHAYVPPVLQLA
jgi:uncharacterized protein YuzE